MSKFQSTVSTVAALASIFGAGAAGWKLAQDAKPQPIEQSQPIQQPEYEERINQLEQKIEQTQQPIVQNVAPPPINLQQPYSGNSQVQQSQSSQPTPPPPVPPLPQNP